MQINQDFIIYLLKRKLALPVKKKTSFVSLSTYIFPCFTYKMKDE